MNSMRRPSILALHITEKHLYNFARLLTEKQILWIYSRLREVKCFDVAFSLWNFILWPDLAKRGKLPNFQLGD